MNARKRGRSLLQSWVRIGIFAMRPVGDKRPPIFANTNEGLLSGKVGGSGGSGGGSIGGWGASTSLGGWGFGSWGLGRG